MEIKKMIYGLIILLSFIIAILYLDKKKEPFSETILYLQTKHKITNLNDELTISPMFDKFNPQGGNPHFIHNKSNEKIIFNNSIFDLKIYYKDNKDNIRRANFNVDFFGDNSVLSPIEDSLGLPNSEFSISEEGTINSFNIIPAQIIEFPEFEIFWIVVTGFGEESGSVYGSILEVNLSTDSQDRKIFYFEP